MQDRPEGQFAVAIGRLPTGPPGRVTMRAHFGGARIVDMPLREHSPRIR